MASDLHPNNENEHRKRKRAAVAANKSKKPKKEKICEYTVVLVEGMKAVARDKYAKPNANKCVSVLH
jgi:hypothetical protein